ncbi:hypothetical protein Glove_225g65 [Diversispora epigaea]|uniref:Phosphatidylinositol N-acetylglucosaminyltransferase subunit Y n=1 Tax=Diversispora epigaea TaxID=1348612 RepID=A0A397IHP4_9GLOM|nr:hypothetical protein Glove_225g65 [Diversispora epigaea]
MDRQNNNISTNNRYSSPSEPENPDTAALWGCILLFSTFWMFVLSLYSIVMSEYVPETGNTTLDWIKKDEHYCLLIPITLPVAVYAIFWNWLGMKFFKHN